MDLNLVFGHALRAKCTVKLEESEIREKCEMTKVDRLSRPNRSIQMRVATQANARAQNDSIGMHTAAVNGINKDDKDEERERNDNISSNRTQQQQ